MLGITNNYIKKVTHTTNSHSKLIKSYKIVLKFIGNILRVKNNKVAKIKSVLHEVKSINEVNNNTKKNLEV